MAVVPALAQLHRLESPMSQEHLKKQDGVITLGQGERFLFHQESWRTVGLWTLRRSSSDGLNHTVLSSQMVKVNPEHGEEHKLWGRFSRFLYWLLWVLAAQVWTHVLPADCGLFGSESTPRFLSSEDRVRGGNFLTGLLQRSHKAVTQRMACQLLLVHELFVSRNLKKTTNCLATWCGRYLQTQEWWELAEQARGPLEHWTCPWRCVSLEPHTSLVQENHVLVCNGWNIINNWINPTLLPRQLRSTALEQCWRCS